MERLGDILIAKGLVTPEEIQRGADYQQDNGGLLGDCLVQLGLITQEDIDAVFQETPRGPGKLEELDVDPLLLLQLMIKSMYAENLEVPSRIVDSMKLAYPIVHSLLDQSVERKLTEIIGQTESLIGGFGEKRYALSRSGREWAIESLDHNQYVGPAPVSLESYVRRVLSQRITNEWVTQPQMKEGFQELVIPDRFLGRLGPALNSGSAMLIYGPAGNGKTTIAEIIGHLYRNVIYIPYCFEVDGQIVKVFDPSVHKQIPRDAPSDGPASISLQRDQSDTRWVACHRPLVVTGGELTLEMLDLKFSSIAKFYEAPLQVKALNGTFLIDDFGRQRAAPEDILNRWIVPLNSRVDYLSLHTGKSFQIPFDEFVIFSTNMHPDELMDPAFLRRIPYKLETLEPPEPLFRQVFEDAAKESGLELTQEVYEQVIDTIEENGGHLAYFQPKFIVWQVLSSCKFQGIKPQFTKENVEDAMLNLFVRSHSDDAQSVDRGQNESVYEDETTISLGAGPEN